MKELTFYNKYGKPVAYTNDGVDIYLFSGEPVAYVSGDSIYSFPGRHLGWFLNGWIRDHNGHAVFFSDIAQGGPLKPLKQLKPLKGLKQFKPLKGLRQLKPLKPIPTFFWSELSDEDDFFI